MKEIELLFKIDKKRSLAISKRLKKNFVKKIKEVDIYLYPPHKDFSVHCCGRENLRIRKSNNIYELTYKKVIYKNNQYSHSIEKSVNISKFKEALQIFQNIGFRKHFVVHKERKVFEDNNFHITIDNVKDLGMFVEIEWIGNKKNVKKIKQACREKALGLGLKTVQNKGYLRLLEEKYNK